MIVSISGLISSGKDTVANFLVEKYGFQKISWASSLKDVLASIFGWDRTLLEGATDESRVWRETKDEWWSNKLDITITPRFALQHIGTDIFRKYFHESIWISSLEYKILKSDKDIVIPDTRFANEYDAVKRLNGYSWRIKRGLDPEWVVDYRESTNIDDFVKKYPNIHASEYSSINFEYDAVIYNNCSLHKLHTTITNQVERLLVSK